MSRKMHRTAAGRMVDIEALRLANEGVIAIGNMNTNARGDELGPGGRVVKTKSERMNEAYELHTMVPTDDQVMRDANDTPKKTRKKKSTKTAAPEAVSPAPEAVAPEPGPPTLETMVQESLVVSESTPPAPKPADDPFKGGLASALAKSVKVAGAPVAPPPKTSKLKRL